MELDQLNIRAAQDKAPTEMLTHSLHHSPTASPSVPELLNVPSQNAITKRRDSPMALSEVDDEDREAELRTEVQPTPTKAAPAVTLNQHDPTFSFSVGGPFFKLLKGVVETRDKCVDKRILLDIGEDNFMSQWRNTSAHLDSFIDAGSAFMQTVSKAVPEDQRDEVERSWATLNESAYYLRKWAQTGKSQLRELNRWEAWLNVEEDKLYKEFRAALNGPRIPAEDDDEDAVTLNFEPLSTSSASTDPLAHEYYDTIGDMKLIQERIFNAEAEQHKRDLQKEHAIKTGEIVANGKDKYRYQEYVKSRRAMIQEFITKKQKMERLRAECTENGVEIEPPDIQPFLDHSQRPDPPPYKQSHKISGGWTLEEYFKSRGLDRRHYVSAWIDKVEKALSGSRSRSPPGGSRSKGLKAVVKKRIPLPRLPPPPPLPPGLVSAEALKRISIPTSIDGKLNSLEDAKGDDEQVEVEVEVEVEVDEDPCLDDENEDVDDPNPPLPFLPFKNPKLTTRQAVFSFRDRRVRHDPPKRRFSESDLKRTYKTKRFQMLTHDALEKLTSTRSENGIDALDSGPPKSDVSAQSPIKTIE